MKLPDTPIFKSPFIASQDLEDYLKEKLKTSYGESERLLIAECLMHLTRIDVAIESLESE